MVPNLSPQNLVAIDIGKDFMLSHGYIENDFDVREWAAPEFLEEAAKDLVEERWQKRDHDQASRSRLSWRHPRTGSGSRRTMARSGPPARRWAGAAGRWMHR